MDNYFFRKDLLNKRINIIEVEDKKINLSLNESPYNPFSFFSKDDWEDFLNFNINRYPRKDIEEKLKSEICEYNLNKIKPDNILMGNGIDDLLYLLFISISDKNSKILVSVPSYPDYINYSLSCGVGNISINLKENFQLDIDEIIENGKKKDVKMIIFCTPNNPTGNLLKKSDIFYILENIHDKLVVIDEAYFEFSGETFINNIYNYENLIILRSFSKGFFSSGLRFGYLIANSFIIGELLKVKSVFNLSALTQFVALKLFMKKDIIKKYINVLIEERDFLFKELGKIEGITSYKSYTNFLLFRVSENFNHIDLYNYLLKKEISLRNVSSLPMLDNCLRVSIGTKEQNKIFLSEMKKYFG